LRSYLDKINDPCYNDVMLPPIYAILTASSSVTNLVDTRIYRHGSAPQNVVKPYITWFVVNGQPENQISGTPCTDRDTVQIDIWSETDTEISVVALAVRDALDVAGHANSLSINLRELDTRLYRIGFQAEIIQSR
jgi:hypothetical protein